MKKIPIIIIILIAIFISNAQSQDFDSDSTTLRDKMIIHELQGFSYNFFKKDTLIYRVETFDSMLINYGKPILKTRLEYLEITCDSVVRGSQYLLSFRLKSLISDENLMGELPERRTSSPWLNRKQRLWIDSLGNRLQVVPDDTLRYAISPAGAFAPTLILPIKEPYIYINESWFMNSNDTLVENGIPPAIVKQSFLNRALRPLDTLDYACTRFNYIKTGTGYINVLSDKEKIRTESTFSGSGVLTLSKEFKIPIHLFQNLEQKLLIFYPDKDEIPGQHLISTDWTLDKFIPSPDRFPKQQNKGKKKKK